MSAITTLNDGITANSFRTQTNTNFTNLNTDKQETSGKDATGGYAWLTLFKINFKNVANTFTSFFTNSNTASRTYTFQDRNGTIADDTDLATKASLAGSTSQAFSVSQLEVGNASDTTITRSSAWVIAVEWVVVDTISAANTLTNKTITTPVIASIKGAVVTDTDGATITFDKNSWDFHRVVLWGNRTLALSNMAAGDKIVIDLVQDWTGTRTVTWFTTIKWVWGTVPTLTTTINKIDTFWFICTSAGNYQGYIIGQNL
jgi:hypothetical protein